MLGFSWTTGFSRRRMEPEEYAHGCKRRFIRGMGLGNITELLAILRVSLGSNWI